MHIIMKKKWSEKTQEWTGMTEDVEISEIEDPIFLQADLLFTSTGVVVSAPEVTTFMREKEILMWI